MAAGADAAFAFDHDDALELEEGLRQLDRAVARTCCNRSSDPLSCAAMMDLVFDAHLHIVDPRFPLVANDGYLPPAFDVSAYRREAASLGVGGGAVVSGSFQAFDQTYLLDALQRLGPTFVGVTQLPAVVDDRELDRLAAAGVRAVRFNLHRGGSAELDDLERMAHRVHRRVGWHVELYVGPEQLAGLKDRLLALPRICIDHLGLGAAALPVLRELVGAGAYVKATGFGRLDGDPEPLLRELVELAPRRIVFGTDLPSTRARVPFAPHDVERVARAVGPERVRAVLFDNAIELYRPSSVPTRPVETDRSAANLRR